MKKSISPLLGGIILIASVIASAVLLTSILGSIFQSQTKTAEEVSSAFCSGSVKVSGISCRAAPPQPKNSSIILLRFDEESGNLAADEAGYDNNASVNAFHAKGKFSYALKFNQSNNYANTSPFTSPKEIAIEFWVKPE